MFQLLFKKIGKGQAAADPAVPKMADLTIGHAITLDPVARRVIFQDSLIPPPELRLLVVAQGKVELGEQSFLHRMYTDNDAYMIQIQGADGRVHVRVDEIMLWYFHEVIYINTDAEWTEWQRRIRQREFELDAISFHRAWFSSEAASAEPMTYWEDVYHDRVGEPEKRVFQTAMLFQRETDPPQDRPEMLLINMEECNSERSVSLMLGRILRSTDFST